MSTPPPSHPEWSPPTAPPPALPERPEALGPAVPGFPPPDPATWRPPGGPGDAPPAAEPREDGLPGWQVWHAPLALLLGFAGALFGAVILAIIGSAFGSSLDDPPPGIVVGGTIVQDLSLIGAALLFARMSAPLSARAFGIPLPARRGQAIGWMFAAWAAFLVFSVIWGTLVGNSDNDELPKELGVSSSTVNLIAAMVLVCVVAPVCEELFFRGFFFTALRSRLALGWAALITGLVFGGIHAGSTKAVFLVPLAAFGVVLCLLYWRTGSLAPCVALHALNNGLAFGVSEGYGAATLALMAGSAVVSLLVLAGIGRLLPGDGEVPAASGPAAAVT